MLTYCAVVLSLEARKGRLASPLAIFAGLTMVHFCTPAMALALNTGYAFYNHEHESYALEGMLFLFAVLVAYHIGVWGVADWYRQSRACKRDEILTEWSSPSVLAVSGVLFAIGWVTRGYVIESNAYFQFTRAVQGNLEGSFYAAIRTAEILPLHVLYILVIHASTPRNASSRRWLYLVGGATLLELAYWLPTGRKEETILIFLVPMLIRYVRARALPSTTTTLIFTGFVLILFPLVFYYRVVLEQIVLGTHDIWESIPAALAALDAGAVDDNELSPIDIILQRLDLLQSVSACVALASHGNWSSELGSSYELALVSLIPRFIWASKPAFSYSVEFGHVAGLTETSDWVSATSVTFPGEAFLNFGWLGFLPFMLFGAGYSLIYEIARCSSWKQTGLLLYAMTLPTIVYMGGTFSLFFGTLMKILPFYSLLSWIMFGSIAFLRTNQLRKVNRSRNVLPICEQPQD